jgi:hypothetical protein
MPVNNAVYYWDGMDMLTVADEDAPKTKLEVKS